mgnify:CR=1 FL=1
MFPPNPQGRQKGFSLVELLTAGAILVVLAVLGLPVYRKISQQSKAAGCVSNMRQFGIAVTAYRADHNGYLPPGYLNPPTPVGKTAEIDNAIIKKELGEGGYLSLTALPYCPAMRLTPQGLSKLKPGQTEKARLQEIGSYAFNYFLTQTKMEALPGPYWGGYPYPGDHKVVFLVETYFTGTVYAYDSIKFALDGADWGGIFVAARDHGQKKMHFMFLDGHIAALAPKQTNGNYDWSEVFDSWGRDGKYVNTRTAYQ